MALVENILSLENEADSIVAQARAEAKEIEKSAIHDVEAYRRRLAEETHQKVRAFQKEAEEKHKRSVAEMEKDLSRVLNDIDRIADDTLKRQVDRIVIKFSEM
jgi:F0F1-type ATP synthase membrane subunit b/b'